MMNQETYPRTMREAFGHYTGEQFDEAVPVPHGGDVAVSLACFAVFIVLAVNGWLF